MNLRFLIPNTLEFILQYRRIEELLLANCSLDKVSFEGTVSKVLREPFECLIMFEFEKVRTERSAGRQAAGRQAESERRRARLRCWSLPGGTVPMDPLRKARDKL